MMNCGCEKTEKKPSGGEPVMYIGDGVTTEFPIPFGHTGDMVSIKTPHCGISVRVERDCGYQVVDGVVKFITPPPSGTVISFTRDGCPIHARGEWDATKIYRTGDIVTFNDVGYYAKDTSCGVQPSSDSEKWFVVSGLSGTIQIGTVTTGEAGTPASVTNRGTERDAILDFVIPGGSRGEKGDRGEATPQYNTVAEMIADLSIKKGSYVMTGGYYSPGDKGACFYRITDTSGDLKIRLGNGLYAEIADTEITSGKLGIIGTNNAQLIQTAFDQLKRFVIDTDITLQHEVNMHRDNSTLIIRDAAIKYTGSEEAAFHVYGSGNYIIGEGRATISGPGKSSLCAGILLGGESKTRNVLSNLIKNLGIGGFGTGISMYNHQVSDNAVVYFNQISDMYISSCTNGILFTGYANAEIVTNIIFWNVGNANNDGGAIVFKNIGGSHPLDNNISHIFHHASGGATTLNIESASYSVFSHIVCEQGGWAHSLYITQGSSACIYELISNVSAFRILPAGFEDSQNTITDITGIASCAVSTPRLSGRKYFSRSRERTPASLTRYYNAQPGEGVKFPVLIFKTDGSVKVPVIVKIKAYSGTHHNIDFLQRTSEKTIIFPRQPTDIITCSSLTTGATTWTTSRLKAIFCTSGQVITARKLRATQRSRLKSVRLSAGLRTNLSRLTANGSRNSRYKEGFYAMVTLTLNDGTTIAGLSMEHDTFYSPTEITAAMLDGKLSPVRIALSKDDNDGLINQAWTGTIEYAAVQSITQVNGKWAIKLKKISGWKALAEKQTVKYLRVNTLITPMSITKCYMTKTSFQEGSNPLFITFPATGSKGKDYQVKITATVTNYQGYASTYGMKTVHYYGSSGYSLQFIEALSDTGSCINIADNTIHINSGWNGTTIPCYGNVIVEQFFPTDSIPYGKNKQDKPIYTLNDEIWKEITSFTWN